MVVKILYQIFYCSAILALQSVRISGRRDTAAEQDSEIKWNGRRREREGGGICFKLNSQSNLRQDENVNVYMRLSRKSARGRQKSPIWRMQTGGPDRPSNFAIQAPAGSSSEWGQNYTGGERDREKGSMTVEICI